MTRDQMQIGARVVFVDKNVNGETVGEFPGAIVQVFNGPREQFGAYALVQTDSGLSITAHHSELKPAKL